jgi:hypothetical protein
MSDRGSFDALRPTSRALLIRARQGAGKDARALAHLREDLAGLSEDEMEELWRALASADDAGDGPVAAADDPAAPAYAAVDKARRKLLVSADRFRAMLLDHLAGAGAPPAPEAASGSLKALVAAFCTAGRGGEIEAAAAAIVRARSFAHDIT